MPNPRPLLLLALIAVGCGATNASTLARYTHNRQPLPPTEAPADAQYGLYTPTSFTPMVIYTLRKGDKLGFENDDGKIIAVAGNKEFPVQTTNVIRWLEWRQVKR